MDKLVQHIKMDMPGIPKQGLYCYGEASFEANQAMQEPLENLSGGTEPKQMLMILEDDLVDARTVGEVI